ncbi:GDSL esterase/lipase CPRD49-like isoform X2 [Raphanus sativus]|uniref:GDSL esterase/lipase CPRD49-like isoform X2 n=1 Tax=Raphanus sativus TaxID=3726 RepID=A0A9W3CPV8_RAPSA|nr:GDSL esterase/lipase CPRD49-like isoform X2 [Raphanus sativus]
MVGPSRPQIVLFGSSIVQMSFGHGGWGAILSEVYARKADIILRGYYGWNSTRALEVIDKVFPKDALVQPSLVVVYFGGNDSMGPHPSGLGPHVPLPEYVQNMKKIALHLQSLSDSTRIIFLSCPPVDEAKVRQNQRDGIHLSAQGSKLVAAEILRVVKEAEWRPSLHWKSMPTEFSEDSPYDLVAADGKTTLNSSEWTYFWGEQWE